MKTPTPKTPNLETLIAAWQPATPKQRADAIKALHGAPDASIKTPAVIRWNDLAERLQVTKRTARTAIAAAGIVPIVLPGRNRSVGIKTSDLWKLEGGVA